MPDPARVVRSSHTLLTSKGIASDTAYRFIFVIASRLALEMAGGDLFDVQWLDDIANQAAVMAGALTPSSPTTGKSDYGDGSGGRAGRPETTSETG